jgi:hypothetical protein
MCECTKTTKFPRRAHPHTSTHTHTHTHTCTHALSLSLSLSLSHTHAHTHTYYVSLPHAHTHMTLCVSLFLCICSAAKAGIAADTVVWAKELAKYKIRVGAIAPGNSCVCVLKTHIKPSISYLYRALDGLGLPLRISAYSCQSTTPFVPHVSTGTFPRCRLRLVSPGPRASFICFFFVLQLTYSFLWSRGDTHQDP